jgi:hypothetical protein
MTARVEFFCSPREEQDVLHYLTKFEGVNVFDVNQGQMTPWPEFAVDVLPEWGDPLQIYVWHPEHGSLIWHTSKPPVAGASHRSFVMNLFASEEWEARGLGKRDKMIDEDLSPLLYYGRGSMRDGKRYPNLLMAPPSNLQRVGPEYERLVLRTLAWVRRRGKIVHDWRKQSTTIPHTIVNTIYALPDVQGVLQTKDHDFAIM